VRVKGLRDDLSPLTQARSIAERIGQNAVLADVVGLAEQRAEA